MTRKMVRHGDIVYRYYYCPTGKRRGCIAPVMVAEDTLKEIVFNEIRQHIEMAQELVEKIEQMTNQEIIHLFTKEKLAEIEDKQGQLQKLRDYKASLRISEIRGTISVDDSEYMEKAYAQDIILLESKISEATMQLQLISEHIDLYVVQIKGIASLAKEGHIKRAEISKLLKRIIVLSKYSISSEFVIVL